MATNYSNTKDDLLKLFLGDLNRSVIEDIISFRKNNLSLAYEDLRDLTNFQYDEQNLHLNNVKHQFVNTTNTNSINPDINLKNILKDKSPTNRILYLVSKSYKVMVLMRGCPGSGKSFQAINILNRCYINANIDEFIFSADKYFINKHTGHYNFVKSKLIKAHQWAYENTYNAVQLEVTPVIIDNTNILAWQMEDYVKLAVNNGYWIEILEPNTEWAWNREMLFKKNQHSVPFDNINIMLKQYDHTINVENILTRYNLKYNKINQPPIISKKNKNYKLCENLADKNNVINTPSIEINDCKDLKEIQEYNIVKDNEQCTSIKSNYEDSPIIPIVQSIKNLSIENKIENSFHDIPNENEDCKSISSNEEASNNLNKSVNTYENDFLFMENLNEMPKEENSHYVIFGTSRDINEVSENILNMPNGKLDNGTTTDVNDLIGITFKPNLDELNKHFSENVSLLIIELFNTCKGNIDWIRDVLVESGHNISKQKLESLCQCEESNIKIEQNNSFINNSLNSESKSFSKNNRIDEKIDGKKKRRRKKVINPKEKNIQLIDNDLKKKIEKKFEFSDLSYSEHVLKIKQFKNNVNHLEDDIMSSTPEIIDSSFVSKKKDEDKFVHVVVDTSILTQLCDYFGDNSSDLRKTTLPMSVKLPEKLAEDLYYCLIANVPPDIYDQEAILQDEISARKLQEKYFKKNSSNNSNPYTGEHTFASVVSKNNKLQETSDILRNSSSTGCLTNLGSPNIVNNEESHIDNVLDDKPIDNQKFRQEVQKIACQKQHFLNKANDSIRSKTHPSVTAHYLDKAEELKQNERNAKMQALKYEIEQKDDTTLDLHNQLVQDAVMILDYFLDHHISNLKKPNANYSKGRELTIITGRGKHSPNGIARIKPVVLQKIQARGLAHIEPEKPGLIIVLIKKNNLLSEELL